MDTVIGWDAEMDLAERIFAAARSVLPTEDRDFISNEMGAGEWDCAITDMIEAGYRPDPATVAEIRTAWVDGRDDVVSRGLARALELVV